MDLAQACRERYRPAVRLPLWAMAELAIVACDVAEVLGTALALHLLFGISLLGGVGIAALDTVIVLGLKGRGFRQVEAIILGLVMTIGICYAVQLVLVGPDWAAVARGFVPNGVAVHDPKALLLAIGILGATVMPHNLYLHSGIVQTRAYGETLPEKREALKFATIDSTVALCFALLINASILILAAATFHKAGHTDVAELGKAQELLQPLLGASIAPTLFAIALLCCGLNSTVTATMAGQIVMEGFLRIRLPAWMRRLVTRLVAIVPAIAVTLIYGEGQTAKLLILSQVILSLQLPFAVVPLVMFTASKTKMGALVAPRWLSLAAAVIAAIIIVLNLKLLFDVATGA
jgi:manganese transport protein